MHLYTSIAFNDHEKIIVVLYKGVVLAEVLLITKSLNVFKKNKIVIA